MYLGGSQNLELVRELPKDHRDKLSKVGGSDIKLVKVNSYQNIEWTKDLES
jgi:hypothetical protein